MSILFAACEPGSCRALLPVALSCRRAGLPVAVLGRGSMAQEAQAAGFMLLDCPRDEQATDDLLQAHDIQVLVFSSNISDPLPLTLARRAARRGVRTLHVLDYWNGYASRMELDGLAPFRPDVYAVPDELAQAGALREGIVAETLVVVGQPAFADVAASCRLDRQARRALRLAAGCDPELPLVLFVSEPVAQDQGSGPDNPAFRGYTEAVVLEHVFAALRPLAGKVQLAALAHPREDAGALRDRLEKGQGALAVRRITPAQGRDALALADGVVGMASTLLYEAWLHGLPVASIQPGLRIPTLALLGQCQGVLFLDRAEGLEASLAAWAADLGGGPQPRTRPEAALHAGTSDRLRDIVRELMGNNMKGLGGQA